MQLQFFALIIVAGLLGQSKNATPDVVQLFTKLQVTTTSNGAATDLLLLAKANDSGRRYIAQHLPTLLGKSTEPVVWKNEIQLAGQLRLIEAIPQLVSLLYQDNTGGPVTLSRVMRMENDPVGKALVEIGDPSVPAVANALGSSDRGTRFRAALVLININSASAQLRLQEHVQRESDPGLKSLIEKSLVKDPSPY